MEFDVELKNRPKSLFSTTLHARPEHPDHHDDNRYRPEDIGDCGVIPHHFRSTAAQPCRYRAGEQKEQSANQPDLKIDIQDAMPQAQYAPWFTKAKEGKLAIDLPRRDASRLFVGKCAGPFGHNAFISVFRVRTWHAVVLFQCSPVRADRRHDSTNRPISPISYMSKS